MRRDIVWERLDRPGLEHLTLESEADGFRIESLVLLHHDAGLIRLRYRMTVDSAWRTQNASFHLDQGATSRSLEIERKDGAWWIDGLARADLVGCGDIDVAATPLTNTHAIKQLGLEPGEVRTFRAVYVKVPDLAVVAADQDYTRLDAAEPPRRFRYQSPGFTAEVTFDADGLVVDYPPGWKRRAP